MSFRGTVNRQKAASLRRQMSGRYSEQVVTETAAAAANSTVAMGGRLYAASIDGSEAAVAVVNAGRPAVAYYTPAQSGSAPVIVRRGGGGGGGGLVVHDISGAYHAGTISDAMAPQFLKSDGSRTLTGNLAVSPGITIDGVDIGAHVLLPDVHHAQQHVLATNAGLGGDHTISGASSGHVLRASAANAAAFAQLQHGDLGGVSANQHHSQIHLLATNTRLGDDHTISGATAGHVLRASSASAAAFAQLQHADLGGVTANQHHNQIHSIIGSDHTASGARWNVVGLTNVNTLGLILPSYNVGAENALLMTDSDGALSLQALTAGVRLRSPLIDTATGALTLAPATDLMLSPLSNLTKIADGKAIQSSSFNSGFAGDGLRIDQGISRPSKTTIEIDDLYVRGRMHVYELLIHQIRATNGSIFVSSTGKAKTVSDSGSGYYVITTDPETAHGFLQNDVIRAQRFTGSGTYQCDMVVSAVANAYTFTAFLAAGPTPAAGMEFVRLGNTSDTSRQGSLYLTADDSGAPFIDVVDGVLSHAGWNSFGSVKVRIGKLTGITGTANEYGILARNGTDYTSSSIKASTSGIEIKNASLYLYDGSGNNEGNWTTVGIELPVKTSAFRSVKWTLPGEAETGTTLSTARYTNLIQSDLSLSVGSSRTGYNDLSVTGFDAGPVLGQIGRVRAGVARVAGASKTYTEMNSSNKNYALGPAFVVSADTSAVSDPTANRSGLYLTNVWTGYPDGNSSSAEIANDTGAYKALMLIGNKSAGGTRRVRFYDVVSIAGAAFNETLNVGGTTELNGATARPLKLTTSSPGPYALEIHRSDLGNSVQMYNSGGALYVNAPITVIGNTVWHAGNDGAGSGLDADTVDGQHGAYYLPAGSYNAADVLAKILTVDGAGSGLDADTVDGQHGAYYLPAGSYNAADVLAKILTVDGGGSGLDADTVDGLHASSFLQGSNWIALTYTSPWTNYDINNWGTLSYRKIGDIVYVVGMVARDSTVETNQVIATLPAGYRPGKYNTFMVNSSLGSGSGTWQAARVNVETDGSIRFVVPYVAQKVVWMSLHGIVFSTQAT